MKPLIAIAIKWLILGTFLQSYQISQIRSYVYICCHAFVNKQGYHEYYYVLFVKNIKLTAQYGYTFKSIQFKRNIIGHPICISIRSRQDYPGLLLSFFVGIRILWLVGLFVWGLAVDPNTLSSDKWYDNGQASQGRGETLILVAVVFTFH